LALIVRILISDMRCGRRFLSSVVVAPCGLVNSYQLYRGAYVVGVRNQ